MKSYRLNHMLRLTNRPCDILLKESPFLVTIYLLYTFFLNPRSFLFDYYNSLFKTKDYRKKIVRQQELSAQNRNRKHTVSHREQLYLVLWCWTISYTYPFRSNKHIVLHINLWYPCKYMATIHYISFSFHVDSQYMSTPTCTILVTQHNLMTQRNNTMRIRLEFSRICNVIVLLCKVAIAFPDITKVTQDMNQAQIHTYSRIATFHQSA